MLALCFVVPLLSGLGPRWFGWVWTHLLLPNPEWSPPPNFCFSLNTHAFKQRRWHTIPTTRFETIWNGSVQVTFHLQKHPGASFSVPSLTSSSPSHNTTACMCSHGKDKYFGQNWNHSFLKLFVSVKTVAYCAFIPHRVHIVEMVNVMNGSQMKLRCDLFHFFTALLLHWHFVCIARLGCWAARHCCLAWPSCKLTISQAKREWHQPWVKGTGPVPRATKPTRITATTTTDTRSTTDRPTTATWDIHQLGAAHRWWERKKWDPNSLKNDFLTMICDAFKR